MTWFLIALICTGEVEVSAEPSEIACEVAAQMRVDAAGEDRAVAAQCVLAAPDAPPAGGLGP